MSLIGNNYYWFSVYDVQAPETHLNMGQPKTSCWCQSLDLNPSLSDSNSRLMITMLYSQQYTKILTWGYMLIGKWLFLFQNDVLLPVPESLPWSSFWCCSSHSPHSPSFCRSLSLTTPSLQPCPGQLRTWMAPSPLCGPPLTVALWGVSNCLCK